MHRVAAAADARAPAAPQLPSPWSDYWARLTCHHDVFASEAAFFVSRMLRVLGDTSAAAVLDVGCGFGLTAAALAPHVRSIVLWDTSPAMRRHARAHVAAVPNARVATAPPRDACFDLIVLNSVVQYMAPAERRAWLAYARETVTPTGSVVVSDVPRDPSLRARGREIFELARFHRSRGRLVRVLRERAADAIAYWRAVRAAPLVPLDRATLEREAGDADLAVTMLSDSLTCRRHRLAAMLRPRPANP
jgi:SAM-dependent methyltransferase